MRRHLLSLLLLCVLVGHTKAIEWIPAVLETVDGERIECLLFPLYESSSGSKLKFKLNENAPAQKLSVKKVRYIEQPFKNGSYMLSLRIPVVFIKHNGKYSHKTWLWVLLNDDPRRTDKVVMFQWTNNAVLIQEDLYGCFRNTDDFGVLCIYSSIIGATSSKNAIKTYMGDCPELVDYIEHLDHRIKSRNEFQKLIDEYNACK